MIDWIKRDHNMIEGKEYLLTNGHYVLSGHFARPYSDKSRLVWFSNSANSYIRSDFSHYAELNFPLLTSN